MVNTPLSERTHIVLSGLRNAGKSTLMNNLFEKNVAIVSDTPGTTTDPVTRAFELIGFGPVAITDTAGFDDLGDLGQMRVRKTESRSKAADINLLVTRGDVPPGELEVQFAEKTKADKKPLLVALTFGDKEVHPEKSEWAKKYSSVVINNIEKTGLKELKEALISYKKIIVPEVTPVEGLVNEGDLVLLVTPIDLAAPKGRLIMPQVETIRDLLDRDCGALMVKERELFQFYNNLKEPPKLVITDSQAFHKVAADIPDDQLLTSFSILFARKKGELTEFIRGIQALKEAPAGCKILVMEACSHHRQADDIGTVKIPRLFKQLVRSDAEFHFTRELPTDEELKDYFMVIHCASCMLTRSKFMVRLEQIKKAGIYVTNYGLFLGWINGLLPRAIEPFPDLYEEFKDTLEGC